MFVQRLDGNFSQFKKAYSRLKVDKNRRGLSTLKTLTTV